MTEQRSNETVSHSNRSILYLGWLAIAFFYFYQYILRVAPGVLVTDLRSTFHLAAEQFSTLGSFYLYAYSLCQIPLGILVDFIGIRKTIIASILLCVTGAVTMAYAPSLPVLQLSRVLIGLGSAAAFMCSLKIVVDYLPPGQRGLLMGATLTLGTLGALVAGKPLALLSDYAGWRVALSYTAMLGVIVFIFAWFFLPKPREEHLISVSPDIARRIGRSMVEVIKTKTILIYAILAIGVYTPLSTLADLWGVAFLMQKFNFTRPEAAEISMMMYVGLGIGCFLLPWLGEKFKLLNQSIRFCTFLALFLFGYLLYGPSTSPATVTICLILLGACCGVEMICFTGASYYTHAKNVGTTLGIVNTFNMLGGGVLQQVIGFVLDKIWSGRLDAAGVRMYTTEEYTTALSVLFGVIIICCIASCFLPREMKRMPLLRKDSE